MRRGMAMIFAAILFAGFVLPYFIWDNYLTIFTFHDQVKGNIYDTVAAVAAGRALHDCAVVRRDATRVRHGGSDRVVARSVRDVRRHQDAGRPAPADRAPGAGQAGSAQHRGIHRPRALRRGSGCVPARVGALHHDRSALRIPGALSAENRLGHGSRRRAASAAHRQAAAVGAPTRFSWRRRYASKRDCLDSGPDAGHRLLGRNPARVSPHHRLPRPAPHRPGGLSGRQAAEHPVHSARRDGDDGRGLSRAEESARAPSGRHAALSLLHADSVERGDARDHPVREHHHPRRAFRPVTRARHAACFCGVPAVAASTP